MRRLPTKDGSMVIARLVLLGSGAFIARRHGSRSCLSAAGGVKVGFSGL